jgi:manganese efflux pump family protein
VLALFLVAVSVALDNLGAATALGVSGVDRRVRRRIVVVFGVFEAAMPLLGLLLGRTVASSLGSHTKVVAGVVLCVVGAYAVVSDLVGERPNTERRSAPSLARLIVLGATLSIDNLAIGFALGSYHVNILVAALVIAGFSVTLTLVGLEVGSQLGERLGKRAELVGGLMLIGIGTAVGTGLL